MTNKILGIDHGGSRLGLAISDSMQMIAMPYKKLENSAKLIDEIRAICQAEEIKKIVVGLPLALSGDDTEQTKIVREFANDLKKDSELIIEFEDERLTSKMATQVFSRDEKDVQAAVIILQSYLDKNN
ncbi:MAG: Holliday junction resolvase RuvX [Patescibacteria group bacterium]